TCEYKCGNRCSSPLPDFSDSNSCAKTVADCVVQKVSCLLKAGFSAALTCFKFPSWYISISKYCCNSCSGKNCEITPCKQANPSAEYTAPASATVSRTVVLYASTKAPNTPSALPSSSTDAVPVPSQPSNPSKGYSSSTLVGGILLPCITCNNWEHDCAKGNIFKLYTESDSKSCKSYDMSGTGGPTQDLKDACDAQYTTSCVGTYANGCKANNKGTTMVQKMNIFLSNRDSYNEAVIKCKNQRTDRYSVDQAASAGSRCSSFNHDW
ncbi:hypothetical protein BJ878DRAFT_426811, partial [Calycina marina]